MIDAHDLTRKFGSFTAVDGLTFHVTEGEVFGFLGPNGAGKTTTVRMLCCLISKTSGEARIADYEVGNDKDSLNIRKLIGLVPDNVGLCDALSAYDNLDFYGKLYDCTETQRKENIKRFLKMLDLWEKRDIAVGTFSKGMKQKLALARALIHDPKILFMDEPTANLDPEATKTVRDFIIDLKKQKKTIFLNTHNLDEASRICDRIGILNTRLMAIGTRKELERLVGTKRTVIQLEQVNEIILSALKKLSLAGMTNDESKITIEQIYPENENPPILATIMQAGGRIQSVTVLGSTLEDAYLELVKRKKK